ncbi:ATP-binding protein [Micromonospora sp. WMMD737]|uniref:ATP-binding protein n=1 Tax=Micromonospora sp. WMMD737 TaxID=3404113 RepID=UPI003B925A06
MTDQTHNPDEPERFDVGDFLAGKGIDPANLSTGGDYTPTPFDHARFRTERALGRFAAKVPPAFADARADHSAVRTWLARLLADPAAAPSLLLVGPTGVGKTHQGWGVIREVVETTARQGRPLRWEAVTHPDLNAQTRVSPDGSHHGVLERYMQTGLLMLDDIGAGKQSDWTGDTLFRLIDYRWAHQLPGIYSTNLIGDPLVKAVGDRVASRLGDAFRVALVGNDRRWRQA